MTINSHLQTFAGLPVALFESADVADPSSVAWRVEVGYDDDGQAGAQFRERLARLVAADWAGQVVALVIGEWGESYDTAAPIAELTEAAGRLTGLRALFIGDMTSEENEISWINQGDVTPLLQAYPALEILRVRGADGLELSPVRHESLRELAFESGGLPAEIVTAVGECDLPALRRLELWLGTANYGGDAIVADLAAIFSGARLPALEYLGLCDSEIADQLAAALAGAPVVARLRTLDLSLGALSDVGAASLLTGQPLTHLSTLDIHHHFVTDPMLARLRAELPGVAVDDSEQQEADSDGDRYIAVSE